MIPEFTIVLGVDAAHIPHLQAVFPTWMRCKPSLKNHPVQIFLDRDVREKSQGEKILSAVVDHPNANISSWPPEEGVIFPGTPGGRWDDPQRYKMLSGFIYTAAEYATTPYWLKLDLDVVALGRDDWIEEEWFEGDPAIVSAPWPYTKPADQILKLDRWVSQHPRELVEWNGKPALCLAPRAGSDLVRHSRIISWCAFFSTQFTKRVAEACSSTCGKYQMPVPSQDGVMWYLAKRGDYKIHTVQMKNRGWGHWKRLVKVREEAEKALEDFHVQGTA